MQKRSTSEVAFTLLFKLHISIIKRIYDANSIVTRRWGWALMDVRTIKLPRVFHKMLPMKETALRQNVLV